LCRYLDLAEKPLALVIAVKAFFKSNLGMFIN
jgi:hypothetical protein